MWGVIDWWVCVVDANGILWCVLTPRLTRTVIGASFNVRFMVIECSEVRHKCFQFLTTSRPLYFSLPLPFLSSLFILHFLLLLWHFLPCLPGLEGGGELHPCDCSRQQLIGNRPKNCLNALQMMGQLRETKWLNSIPDIWSILCAAEHIDCFSFAFSELRHQWEKFHYGIFYGYNWRYTLRCGLQHTTFTQHLISLSDRTLRKSMRSADPSLTLRTAIYKDLVFH